MISRAASRTSSERPSAASPPQSISAFNRSRVRSRAGILSIGMPLRLRPVAKPELVDSPIWRGLHPILFPATLGRHGKEGVLFSVYSRSIDHINPTRCNPDPKHDHLAARQLAVDQEFENR